jgi:hypothetical protein
MKMIPIGVTVTITAVMIAVMANAQDAAVISTMLSPAVYQPGTSYQPEAALPKPDAANAVRVVLDRTKLTDPAQRMTLRLFYTLDGVESFSLGAVTIVGGVFFRNGEAITASSMGPSINSVPPDASFFTVLTINPDAPPAETAVAIQFREVK